MVLGNLYSAAQLEILLKCVIKMTAPKNQMHRKANPCEKYLFFILTLLLWCLVQTNLDPEKLQIAKKNHLLSKTAKLIVSILMQHLAGMEAFSVQLSLF
jgi:hypothetical protein